MQVREIWNPKAMSASGTLVTANGSTAGVLCTTAGTFVISAGIGSGGATLVASVTGVAGTWYPLPFKYPTGAYVTIGGSGVFTFAVS
jgi:hypothetical protein